MTAPGDARPNPGPTVTPDTLWSVASHTAAQSPDQWHSPDSQSEAVATLRTGAALYALTYGGARVERTATTYGWVTYGRDCHRIAVGISGDRGQVTAWAAASPTAPRFAVPLEGDTATSAARAVCDAAEQWIATQLA